MLDYRQDNSSESIFFSIVIPIYNCKNYVLDAITSVENQTFKNWEAIIVDDNSTDGTYEIVEEYTKTNEKIKVLRTPINSGSPGGPRDYGVQEARGKYIGFLDGDDIYHPEKLQRHFDTIRSNLFIELIHTSYNIVDESKIFLIHKKKSWLYKKILMRFLDKRTICILTNPFGASTIVFKSELIKKYSFKTIPKLLNAVEDRYLWLRMLNDNIPVIYYDTTPLTDYRWVNDSISDRNAHKCELQAVIFFSILLYERKINIFEWCIGVFIRLARIVCTKFLGYKVV